MLKLVRNTCFLGLLAVLGAFLCAAPQAFAQETVSGTSGVRAQSDAAATDVLRHFQDEHKKIYDKIISVQDHVMTTMPICSGVNDKIYWNGTAWSCTTETDPTAKNFAKSNLPTCGEGQVLTATNSTAFSCVTPTGGAKGDTPNYAWSGTQLRFEKPDGSWGAYVNLKGEKGADVVCP